MTSATPRCSPFVCYSVEIAFKTLDVNTAVGDQYVLQIEVLRDMTTSGWYLVTDVSEALSASIFSVVEE